MSNIILTSPTRGGAVIRPAPVVIDVDGHLCSQLALLEVTAGSCGEGLAATFEWTGQSPDFGAARSLVPAGRQIRARIARSGLAGLVLDWPVFDGYIIGIRVEFGGQKRRVLVDAIDGVRFHYEGLTIGGVHSLDATGRLVAAPHEPVIFNSNGRPDRSLSQISINGRACHVFDFSGGGGYWSAGDIANYLIASRLLDSRVDWPGSDRLESLCGQIRPHGLDLTGDPPLAALERLAQMCGCGFAIEPLATVRRGGRWRVTWFSGTGRRLVAMHHQRARQPATMQTNVAEGVLEFQHDCVRRVWQAMGEPERVESTFALVGGWSDSQGGGGHRIYSRANPEFDQVRDVYRRWVLNEAGDWTGGQYGRGPSPDLAALFGTKCTLLRRRRFRPTLSRDASGRSFGVPVDVSYNNAETWRKYPGRIEVLADEAGIWIADDQLPPDYWQAAVAGTLAVRATASIESDRRVSAELVESPRADVRRVQRRVCYLPGRFRRQWVADSSVLAGHDADEVDDRAALAEALAEQRNRQHAGGTAGQLSLPWLSGVYQVGDRVVGIAGQRLSFDSAVGEPLVRAVRHQLGEQWQTTLELE